VQAVEDGDVDFVFTTDEIIAEVFEDIIFFDVFQTPVNDSFR
jgi:hypothetical protein